MVFGLALSSLSWTATVNTDSLRVLASCQKARLTIDLYQETWFHFDAFYPKAQGATVYLTLDNMVNQ